jgi:integrase
MNTTYDVRVYGLLPHKAKSGKTTYTVRWKVGVKAFRKPFATKALAESQRSILLIAQKQGVAFDIASGLPEPLARATNSRSWLKHAMDFVDMKWSRSSPKHRVSIADALATVTPALLSSNRGAPTAKEMRAALYGWAFNTARRTADNTPDEITRTLEWIDQNSLPVSALSDSPTIRKALDHISLKIDKKPAAATTIARKRAVFSASLKYAVELGLLESHPFLRVSWSAPKAAEEIDRRSVINPQQALSLLAAARKKSPDYEAFFACLYYAALRPEEALFLRPMDYIRPTDSDDWGWLQLAGATVTLGVDWSDGENLHQDRSLKHRSATSTRRVPVVPELAKLLDEHIERHRIGDLERLFVVRSGSHPGRPLGSSSYGRVWRLARAEALTAAQQDSPLAKVPYQLRHAAVSLWLNSGVPATQVAEWAGHSVNVLMKVYAKCIDGQEDAARRRLAAALATPITSKPKAIDT